MQSVWVRVTLHGMIQSLWPPAIDDRQRVHDPEFAVQYQLPRWRVFTVKREVRPGRMADDLERWFVDV
jgi:hypothetical protein